MIRFEKLDQAASTVIKLEKKIQNLVIERKETLKKRIDLAEANDSPGAKKLDADISRLGQEIEVSQAVYDRAHKRAIDLCQDLVAKAKKEVPKRLKENQRKRKEAIEQIGAAIYLIEKSILGLGLTDGINLMERVFPTPYGSYSDLYAEIALSRKAAEKNDAGKDVQRSPFEEFKQITELQHLSQVPGTYALLVKKAMNRVRNQVN
jgi:hypothetical protein